MSSPPKPELALTEREFTQRFSSTKLGARLARHLALYQLHRWGVPPGSDVAEAAGLIVGELAANAATHGRVPGRDFELRLLLGGGVLRIEVTDTRGDRLPQAPHPEALAESGRGLLLVAALADAWAVTPHPIGKTVHADLSLPR